MECLPKPPSRVRRVGQADPICRSRLPHAEIQHQWHGQDRDVGDVASVYKRLLGLLGQRLPPADSLLRCDVSADRVDVEIRRDALRRNRQNRVLVGRVREGRRVVHDDTGRGVELGLDRIEQRRDRVGLGQVGLEREEPFGRLGAVPFPRRNGDLVAVAGELLGDRGADPGPGSEDKYDRFGGCHCSCYRRRGKRWISRVF